MTPKQAAQEIRELAAGTVGNLIGVKGYATIDKHREEAAAAVENSGETFGSWVEAWHWWTDERPHGEHPTLGVCDCDECQVFDARQRA